MYHVHRATWKWISPLTRAGKIPHSNLRREPSYAQGLLFVFFCKCFDLVLFCFFICFVLFYFVVFFNWSGKAWMLLSLQWFYSLAGDRVSCILVYTGKGLQPCQHCLVSGRRNALPWNKQKHFDSLRRQ